MNHEVNDIPTAEQLAQRLEGGKAFILSADYAAFLQRWGQDQARQARQGGPESPEMATKREAMARRLDAALSAATDGD